LLAFLAIAQSTVMPLVAVSGTKPDLLFLAVVSWSLLRGAEEGIVWGFIGGMFLDILSGGPFGVSAIALMSMSLLTGFGETNFFRGHFLLPLAIIPFGTVIYYSLILMLLALLGQPLPWGQSFLRVMLPAALVNLAVMPLVHWGLAGLHRKTGRQQIEW
jgi:rod shape-determining protein MreD